MKTVVALCLTMLTIGMHTPITCMLRQILTQKRHLQHRKCHNNHDNHDPILKKLISHGILLKKHSALLTAYESRIKQLEERHNALTQHSWIPTELPKQQIIHTIDHDEMMGNHPITTSKKL